MLDKEIGLLVTHLSESNCIGKVKYVKHREHGFDDSGTYLRLATDDSAKNFFFEDDYISATFLLVGFDGDLEKIIALLMGFNRADIRLNSAGTNAEEIYRSETGKDLRDDANLFCIEFELKTIFNCSNYPC